MSRTKKRGSTHNPSPYMRRFQLPNLTFADNTGYDELLSPLETESKKQLIDEKNREISATVESMTNYFGFPSTTNDAPTSSTRIQDNQSTSSANQDTSRQPKSGFLVKKETVRQQQPQKAPPVPPHRPRQRLIDLEKYRMCHEIAELEKRSREMLDMLVANK